MSFTHLHVHSEYSLLDGAARIGALVSRCKELGMDSIAITDHGVMYGVIDFYKAAKAAGVKPIIGCEVYVAARSLKDSDPQDRESSHLVLLCKNMEGYHNLCKLVSIGFVDGFYYRPRIDYDTLEKYSSGLVCLSACLAGDIPRLMEDGRLEEAEALALRLDKMFGRGNFFLELQDHGIAEQRRLNPKLIRLSNKTGIPLVATNDCHYVLREDAKAQDILLCIQTKKTVSDPNRMRFQGEEFYVKSPEEMAELFDYVPDALANTGLIADMCQVDFDFKTVYLPDYKTPGGMDHFEYLHQISMEGYAKRYENPPEEYLTRLEYELSVIKRMGYTDYFLIVWDYVDFAKRHGIMVGPGRGSGAGSMVAYCLSITDIDPMRYNLLFERFLNPERISMPDFDVDFCVERRQEVIDYVVEKYGADHVAQIITFGTMAARAVIRDVGRVMDVPYSEVDKVSKMIPAQLNMTIELALTQSKELRDAMEADSRIAELITMSKKLEGLPRHASTHAAAVVISKLPLTDHVPLNRNRDAITTQYAMGNIEQLGLLKMDFLGLRNLTVIRDATDMIRQGRGEDIKVDNLPFDDPDVFRLISSGETDGVFQLESTGMRAFMRELKPTSLEDIMAGISLYRPGPMASIPKYIQGKMNPSAVVYEHPVLKNVLEVTYGCMIYQEQVMQIVRDMAGYSMGRSDLVRRAMAKKKADVMEKERQYFIYGMEEDGKVVVEGALRRGVSLELATRIFDEMQDFASYAFNKPHAAGYAVVAYWTAWLKVHYPLEFMAALMNSVGNMDKIAVYVQYCRRQEIPVLPPDINMSAERFSVQQDAIRFGLSTVKNVGLEDVRRIIRMRPAKGYQDFFEFAHICADGINKRMVEALIKAGAFDSLNPNRAQLLAIYEGVLESAVKEKHRTIQGQLSLFGDLEEENTIAPPPIIAVDDFPAAQKLAMEKEMIGIYISGHPLDAYAQALAALEHNTLMLQHDENAQEEQAVKEGQIISLAGMIQNVTYKTTRKNEQMAFVTLEDLYSTVEVIIFPRVLERAKELLAGDQPVLVRGRVNFAEEETGKLLAESVTLLRPDSAPVPAAEKKPEKLFIRFPADISAFAREVFKGLLVKHAGEMPVYLLDESTGKKYNLGARNGVRYSDELMRDMVDLLGEANVKTGA